MKTILVIEDEESIRESIADVLEMSNYNVLVAPNGLIGIKLAKLHKPDLVLCDVMMPEVNGYEFLTLLRQDAILAATPLVFLTAKSEKEDIRQGMNLGADDYLTKPVGSLEILEVVTSRLKKQNTFNNHVQNKLDSLRASISLSLPHELRTPLTGILGLSEILVEDYTSISRDDLLQIATAIHSSAQRLNKSVQNVLTYAELEIIGSDAKKISAYMSTQATAVTEIIRKVAISRAKSDNRENDLILDISDATVQIQETKFQKIVEEIVDNAFKYSLAGTKVTITSRSDRWNLTLSITDYGRGMSRGQIAEIGAYMQFERSFYEQQGSGLGLYIAQRLVQLHNGEFRIDSEPQEQTKVWISLPLAFE